VAGYFIAHIEVGDWDTMRQYQRQIFKTLEPFGGKVVAADPGHSLEGEEPPNLNVIIEFENAQKAKDWYASPAYQDIIATRLEASQSRSVMVLEGLPPRD
jgi:uncharacterized protein (DUF1330 family)